jgi:hypothetical protein
MRTISNFGVHLTSVRHIRPRNDAIRPTGARVADPAIVDGQVIDLSRGRFGETTPTGETALGFRFAPPQAHV